MKLLRVIFVNIVIIVFLLLITEGILYYCYQKKHNNEPYHIGKIPYFHLLYNKGQLRKPEGLSYNKNPIIISGCSFAFGENLSDSETFSYKLSEYTKRPVYNYAIKGKGFQSTLFIIQNGYLDKNIKNPEYLIYVMIDDHVRRMYSSSCMGDYVAQPIYKLNKEGYMKMHRDYYPSIRQFYTFYYFNNLIYNYFLKNNLNHNNMYIVAYLKTIRDEIQKIYPHIKIVLYVYDNSKAKIYSELLKNDQIIVIGTKDITDIDLYNSEYRISENDSHPNALAWDIVVPAISKKLDL